MPVEHKSVGRIFSDFAYLEYNLHFSISQIPADFLWDRDERKDCFLPE